VVTAICGEDVSVRKIIQISVSTDEDCDTLFALCNDGSVWRYLLMRDAHCTWVRILDIPQDEP